MPEPTEQTAPPADRHDRHWLAKMLVASAVLAAALLGAAFLTPALRLHYHAWMFRSGRDTDGKHLGYVAESLARRKAAVSGIAELLASPNSKFRRPDETEIFYVYSFQTTQYSTSESGWLLEVRDGQVVACRADTWFHATGKPMPPGGGGTLPMPPPIPEREGTGPMPGSSPPGLGPPPLQ
jgi:hypothetical protein